MTCSQALRPLSDRFRPAMISYPTLLKSPAAKRPLPSLHTGVGRQKGRIAFAVVFSGRPRLAVHLTSTRRYGQALGRLPPTATRQGMRPMVWLLSMAVRTLETSRFTDP